MGKRKNKADPLTEEDEKALWESGVLGGDNPSTLNHTIWYLLSQQLGTRGNQEHTEIMMEDLTECLRLIRCDNIMWSGQNSQRLDTED